MNIRRIRSAIALTALALLVTPAVAVASPAGSSSAGGALTVCTVGRLADDGVGTDCGFRFA
jgi:hypothetical protein